MERAADYLTELFELEERLDKYDLLELICGSFVMLGVLSLVMWIMLAGFR